MKKYLKAVFCTILFLASSLILTGCFALPVEDPVLPAPVVRMPRPRPLRTQVVQRGDVSLYANVTALYVQTREDSLAFPLEGLRVQGIYVNIGDFVHKGDIIATLYWPEVMQQYTAAQRQEELLRLNLSQLNTRRSRGLVDASSYTTERNRINRELDLLEEEMDLLKEWHEKLYLRASMDGTITRIATFTEGMISDTRYVATIADMTHSIFEIRTESVVDYMNVGDHFTITITVSQASHDAVVVDPYEIGVDRSQARGNEVYLALLDDVVLSGSITGSVFVEKYVVRDVVLAPVRSVHRAGGRVFVYILNEQGIRVIRDVETGMRGNLVYEIISGLDEGEMIVLG